MGFPLRATTDFVIVSGLDAIATQPKGRKHQGLADPNLHRSTIPHIDTAHRYRLVALELGIFWCPGWDLNPHSRFRKKDFKSFASADFATRALLHYSQTPTTKDRLNLNLVPSGTRKCYRPLSAASMLATFFFANSASSMEGFISSILLKWSRAAANDSMLLLCSPLRPYAKPSA